MNTVNEQDKEIEATLQRVATHLSHRGSEYLEHPMTEQLVAPGQNSQKRRLLVGTVAAATLTVTALAGSFIGGSSSGKVDVAKAAWSAVPVALSLTGEDVLNEKCASPVKYQMDAFVAENGADEFVPVPKPELVASDARGTSLSGLYLAPSQQVGAMCIVLEGKDAVAIAIDFGDGDMKNGNVRMRSWSPAPNVDYTLFTGFLPTSESPDDVSATVYLDTKTGEEPKAIIATIDPQYHRYIAWSPSPDNGRVTFFKTATGEPMFSICPSDEQVDAIICPNVD
ncbi:MAG: hypothetical protein RLZZ526_47 [Actinomycetota bacterium]|jgi:hypothetical protein